MTDLLHEFFTTTVARDFADLMLGEKIGSGSARVVFAHPTDANKVIKFEVNDGSFQNILEYEAWGEFKHYHKDIAKQLAPCHTISSNGIILIQERTFPVPQNFKWPEKMPAFMTDFKKQNFGMIGKRLVCHDYGTTFHLSMSATKKTRKTDWWSE